MDVLMIAHYTATGWLPNDRFDSLASVLARRGAEVELVTSSFQHAFKTQRDTSVDRNPLYSTTYVHEPPYRSNVSAGRLRSHRALGRNLAEYLRRRKVPDIIYCSMPSLEVAHAAAEFAEKNEVRFILDVQDLWPEAFEMVLRPRWMVRQALIPIRRRAEAIYRAADAVVTVSETYSERVSSARRDGSTVSTVYLGSDLTRFDTYPVLRPPRTGIAELAYIGTLGHSYDLPSVFGALRELRKEGIRMRLHVMGTGPFEECWREEAGDLDEDVVFYGKLEYPEMVSRLRGCDIAINPIVANSAASIINKVCDYAAAGLPVVNSQQCAEYQDLLTEYGAGINCESTPAAFAEALKNMANDRRLAERGRGSRRMAEDHFDRSKTYERLGGVVLDAH